MPPPCIYDYRECSKRCGLWIDKILTAKVKQLVLVYWKTPLYTKEMPLYIVKQVVLLLQNGIDVFFLCR